MGLAAECMRGPVFSLLRALLGSESPLLLGFSFHHDLAELARSQWANACREVCSLCDLQLLATSFSGAPPGASSGPRTVLRPKKALWPEGLAALVKRSLGAQLCKEEQKSYWRRRPLRASQRHYAALDAFVLLQVASALMAVPLEQQDLLAARLRALN